MELVNPFFSHFPDEIEENSSKLPKTRVLLPQYIIYTSRVCLIGKILNKPVNYIRHGI